MIGGCGFRTGLASHHRPEIDELAVIFRLRLGPDFLHGLDALARELMAGVEVGGAVVGHFLGVPAVADAEQEAAIRYLVERGHQLGGLDRMPLHHESHAGTQLQRLGGGCRGGERDERVHRIVVALGQIAAGGEWRLAGERDMRMLRWPDGFETPVLQSTGEFGGRYGIIGKKDCRAEMHDRPRCLREAAYSIFSVTDDAGGYCPRAGSRALRAAEHASSHACRRVGYQERSASNSAISSGRRAKRQAGPFIGTTTK